MAHTDPLLLSDAVLEKCVDGCTSVELLREILRQPSVVQRNRKVSAKQFAEQFQMALEDYAEGEDANENNYQWGLSIAESINDATEQPIAYVANPKSAWPKP